MRFVSLFAGIGGLDLGLERAGWECVAQVEIEPFARRVLAKHWPAVPRFTDVRQVGAPCGHEGRALDDAVCRGLGSCDQAMAAGRDGPVCPSCNRSHLPACDAIVGGFPCQDISVAGRGDGLSGERSGLWFEFLRLVQEVRPTWVLAENVPALRTRGIDTVLGGLEQEGYACWPVVVGARHVGAPHRRDRVFIVARLADADQGACRWWADEQVGSAKQRAIACRNGPRLADASIQGLARRRERAQRPTAQQPMLASRSGHLRWPSRPGEPQHEWEEPRVVNAASEHVVGWRRKRPQGETLESARTTEPPLGSAVDGLPAGLVRRESRLRRASLKAYGNAVVPQVAEVIGWAILSLHQRAAGRHAGAERAADQADAQFPQFTAAGQQQHQPHAELPDKQQQPLPVDVFPVHFAPPNTRSMRSRKNM